MWQQQVSPESVRALAAQAVPAARSGFSAKLDFTPRSLKSVESSLQKIHAHLKSPANAWTDEQLSSFCLMYGAYIGEVIRRHAGGEVIRRHAGGEWLASDANAVELRITAGDAHVSIHPCEKVRKRVVDGPDDSIVRYYESLTRAVIPAIAGADGPLATPGDAGNVLPRRTANVQKTYSVQFPPGWKSYEKIAGLSAYPPDGQSLITLTGNGGWIPFEKFVAASITHQPPRYVPSAPPREIDAENAIGRCFEFTMQHARGTGAAWAYCLQCPTYMINVSVLSQGPVSDESRKMFDGIVQSIVMTE